MQNFSKKVESRKKNLSTLHSQLSTVAPDYSVTIGAPVESTGVASIAEI